MENRHRTKGVSARYHLPRVGVKKAPAKHIDAMDQKRAVKEEIAVPQNAEDAEDYQGEHTAARGKRGGADDTRHGETWP